MLDHRAGLELLRIALRDRRSPWAHVLEAVSATLPRLRGDEREAVRRLALEGPPEEEVGLAPFATPQFSPAGPPGAAGPTASQRVVRPPASQPLPTPTFPGGLS
jgi:nitrate reductase delta subunit